MKYSVATTTETNDQLLNHLLRRDRQEDLCFALWFQSKGDCRTSALVYEIILPQEEERNVHGNASFNSKYLERVINIALEKESGIAFFHSHLGPGWQPMSRPDIDAELRIAPSVKAVTGLPLLGMTLGTDGSWSARFWVKEDGKYKRNWCHTVRVIGDDINLTFADHLSPVPIFKEEFKSTTSAWGKETQGKLMRLTIGIVGLGSVGSVVAEALARMGVQNIKLFDFDIIKKHNLDRHIHATSKDIGHFKTKVVATRLRDIATSTDFQVDTCEYGVTEDRGFRSALDCDVLFSCVDRPWPRHVLNSIAYWHLIPVIDGGIHIKQGPQDKLHGADWKAHVVGSGHRCLECLQQYTQADVATERDGSLDDSTYINSLHKNHHLRRNENVIAFSLSLASFQLLQALSMIVNPLGIGNVGEFNYHFVSGILDKKQEKTCNKNCLFQSNIAGGDKISSEYIVTGRHKKAESVRKVAIKNTNKKHWYQNFFEKFK